MPYARPQATRSTRRQRASDSFRGMALVALFATLMAALAPTASRVLATASAHAAHHLAGDDSTLQPVDEACGYCMLVAPPPPVPAQPWPPALKHADKATSPLHIVRLRSNRNVRGLGSQAPPLAV